MLTFNDRLNSKISKNKSEKDKVELTVSLSAQIMKHVNLEELSATMKNTTKIKGEKGKYKSTVQFSNLS